MLADANRVVFREAQQQRQLVPGWAGSRRPAAARHRHDRLAGSHRLAQEADPTVADHQPGGGKAFGQHVQAAKRSQASVLGIAREWPIWGEAGQAQLRGSGVGGVDSASKPWM